MEKKHKHQKGGKSVIPAADSFTNCDHSGWMSKSFHDGWLKKRWRKRYCVLANGILYLYEKQTSKGTETSSIAIDLSKFSSCAKASAKESKKSPNTMVLEPIAPTTNANGEKDQNNNVAKEFFYTDNAVDIEKWMSKLKESLSLSCSGAKAKLDHVTKTRARPPKGGGGNRRPPTKQHIKERARMSEIALDIEDEEPVKTTRETKGRIPATAMKPTAKAILPKTTRMGSSSEKSEDEPKKTDESIDQSEESQTDSNKAAKTKSPPKLPPAALKPKSKSDGKLPESSQNGVNNDPPDESESTDEIHSTQNESAEGQPKSDEAITKSPPKLPPAAMKPKLKPTKNNDDEPKVDSQDNHEELTNANSVISEDVPSSPSTESTQKKIPPPTLPPVALKPPLLVTESMQTTEVQGSREDLDTEEGQFSTQDCKTGKLDSSKSKSLTNLRSDTNENIKSCKRSNSF